jgi:hypothetical protein
MRMSARSRKLSRVVFLGNGFHGQLPEKLLTPNSALPHALATTMPSGLGVGTLGVGS